MKVITEAMIREELRAERPEDYIVQKGRLLSPAAKEYLQQCRIRVVYESDINNKRVNGQKQETREASADRGTAFAQPAAGRTKDASGAGQTAADFAQTVSGTGISVPDAGASAPGDALSGDVTAQPQTKPRYRDYATGAFYFEKPEHMTQLHGNLLVAKDHKRIVFRGKLDSLEALFVLDQTQLLEKGESTALVEDLNDILEGLREMMRCDVLDEPYLRDRILGLTHRELRERSHNPMKYYNVKQMVLPDYTLGRTYAILNQLRAAVRETEVAATAAFHTGNTYERQDILEELNRMSSAMHILVSKYLAGDYR